MKSLVFVLFLSVIFISADNGQLNAAPTRGMHHVHVTHPFHGPMKMPVDEATVSAHRPESTAREGVTGTRVGCNPYLGCATK